MDNGTPLDPRELARYARHLVLPEVGVEGQRRLRDTSVAVIGAGGLGAPASLYLAAAGIGRLGLIDFDAVDDSNLQRQVLFGTSDVGRSKVEVAAARLRELNPLIEIEPHEARLDAANAEAILSRYDIVLDGTDNFPTRYLVNDACVLLGKPNVYGSIFRFEGQASVFDAARGPCYRCLYPTPPGPGEVPNCAEGGVLGILPGVIGSIQATEAVKLALGAGDSLLGRLVLFDALEMRFRELRLRKNDDCPACGPGANLDSLREESEVCDVETAAPHAVDITAIALNDRLARGDDIRLIDVRTPQEWAICRIEGADLIPMNVVPSRLQDIERDRDVVVYCHVGGRSAAVVGYLADQGYTRVRNLTGGIRAWADDVDPDMPRY